MAQLMFSVIVAGKIHFGDIEKVYCGVRDRLMDVSFVHVHYESGIFNLKGDQSLEYPVGESEVCKKCLKKILPFLTSGG